MNFCVLVCINIKVHPKRAVEHKNPKFQTKQHKNCTKLYKFYGYSMNRKEFTRFYFGIWKTISKYMQYI